MIYNKIQLVLLLLSFTLLCQCDDTVCLTVSDFKALEFEEI